MGNAYLRKLLVAVALANKLARIVYTVMTTGTSYCAAEA